MTLDCRSCGACCATTPSPAYIGLTEADVQRLPARLAGQVVQTPTFRALACPGGRCCALEGHVGEATSCSIYAARPAVCQAFEPGALDCLLARARAGLPLLGLQHGAGAGGTT